MSSELRYTQNFLVSTKLVEKIVALAHILPGETVLEIGAGKGIITAALAKHVTPTGKVAAIELDQSLIEPLANRFYRTPQVQVMQSDFLTFDLASVGSPYRVFSNVPFNITSELLERLFTFAHAPHNAFLILQTESLVSSSPYGTGETFKSLMILPRYNIHMAHLFSPADFNPRPGVPTALFEFERRHQPLIADSHYELYKDFLAFVSRDRVGEGAWMRLFSKLQLQRLTQESPLVQGRGIKSQNVDGVVAAFQFFLTLKPKHALIRGAMQALRDEQQRREQINQAGGHHRSRRPNPTTPD
jgi:23S rRNA (adenine-N6)-dimethyltransferase